ncbi:leucine--tRNA ligase, partial [bacterium]|nr:leucine--tRNA ligase [bacterium]
MEYRPLDFEEKWMANWAQFGVDRTPDQSNRPKYYVLEMFPYPSGRLHIGHVRNYTIGDCVARFKRMSGFNVLHPPGFDSFGLPAENAAIKNKLDPAKWTMDNIDFMIGQQKRLGLGYDWDRLVVTCKEDYYRWNQWIFIKMMERGLVYRKKGWVNWDPVDQTVLANEQVIDGKGWRSGAEVEKREIEQWYIRITDYAEELLSDLDQLTGWPERVKTMQKNWIGRSEGAELVFKGQSPEFDITVYTTRPDTLFGVTYVVLAPEHPLTPVLATLGGTQAEVDAYVRSAMAKSVMERGDAAAPKTGVALGVTVANPVTGEQVPVFVSDYVLMDYGTGAVMAVPAHDQRDFEFAAAFNLPVKIVIQSEADPLQLPLAQAFTESGILVNSNQFDGITSQDAKSKIVAHLSKVGLANQVVKYRLRDWLISRQRCWGTPIPVAYDENRNAVPVPLDQLPVRFPSDLQFSGKGNPLEHSEEFRDVTIDGRTYRRETDTMDTFFDSSWYFLRFCDPQNTEIPFRSDLADHWGPVDQYIGGIEHAVLHLLYARFFSKVLRDLGLHSVDEPFKHLLCQ